MNSTISIIIPVYNAKEIIDNCLEALNSQTSTDFEVVFIDDCSEDDSCEYIEKWFNKRKSRIFYNIIKNKKNLGPGLTRNVGIKNAKSKYVSFMDSDDIVPSDFISKTIELIDNNSNPDLIIYDYYISSNGNNKKCKSCLLKNYGKIQVDDALALSNGMCWGKVYKKEIIVDNNVEFPNLMRSEDLAFIKTFISHCKDIIYQEDGMYYYVQTDNSIMHSSKTLDTRNNEIAYDYIDTHINNKQLLEAKEMVYIREYLYLIVQIMIIKKHKTIEIKRFIKDSIKDHQKWYKNKYIKYQPIYLKILLFFIRIRVIFPLRLAFLLKK